MKTTIFLAVILSTTVLYSQKKYNFGISIGSEQFYSKNTGYSPESNTLKNAYSNKIGVFVEKKLKNKGEILVGFNYNYYWSDFDYMIGSEPWYSNSSNTFYDMDVHYNYLFTNSFKLFLGTNIIFYRFHDKYYGVTTLEDDTIYATEVNDVTDFNVALNMGVKYEINPKSKIKVEPFVLIGATCFRRDNFKDYYYSENVSSNHFYKNIYTRFGLNVKY